MAIVLKYSLPPPPPPETAYQFGTFLEPMLVSRYLQLLMHNCLDCDSFSFFARVRIVYDLPVRCNNAQEITLASLSLSIVVFYYFLSFLKLF